MSDPPDEDCKSESVKRDSIYAMAQITVHGMYPGEWLESRLEARDRTDLAKKMALKFPVPFGQPRSSLVHQ